MTKVILLSEIFSTGKKFTIETCTKHIKFNYPHKPIPFIEIVTVLPQHKKKNLLQLIECPSSIKVLPQHTNILPNFSSFNSTHTSLFLKMLIFFCFKHSHISTCGYKKSSPFLNLLNF